jgi:hypothetical protein
MFVCGDYKYISRSALFCPFILIKKGAAFSAAPYSKI